MQKPDSATFTTATAVRHTNQWYSCTKAQHVCGETKARPPMQQIH